MLPASYPYMTARQHLDFVAGIRGPVAAHACADLLWSLGLDPQSRKIAKHFSLGMRQRLAIAMSLVHSPRLLVLDEPMNGLDPIGMKDLREAILSLARRSSVAILVSSHLLAEIEQVCERVAILHHGTFDLQHIAGPARGLRVCPDAAEHNRERSGPLRADGGRIRGDGERPGASLLPAEDRY